MTRPDAPPGSLADALRLTLLTPWKANNELRRYLTLPLARLSFALAGIPWGAYWRLYGLPILQRHRASRIILGDWLELRSTVRSNPLGPNHAVILSTRRASSRLVIGHHFGMTGGVLCADEAITIGDYVTVGANTTITDTNFHPLDPAIRLRDPANGATAPVVIEDNVFIGMHCLILKGVTIGRSSVIGAGSVVTRDVPSGVIAAGNPARVIHPLQVVLR